MKTTLDSPDWLHFQLGGQPPAEERFEELFRELQKIQDAAEAELADLRRPWWRRLLGLHPDP